MLGIIKQLTANWRSLLLTDLFFKALAIAVFTPLVSFLFRAFLWMAGHTVLVDADIPRMLLHPIGWLMAVVVGGGAVGILALEQSVMLTLILATAAGKSPTLLRVLHFVAKKAVGIFKIAALIIARLLVLAMPFLLVSGGAFWLFLSEFDINFYLSTTPAAFWWAVVAFTIIAVALGCVVMGRVVNWSLALPIYLFENVAPSESLLVSSRRVAGAQLKVAGWLIGWSALNLLVSTVASAAILAIGRWIVPLVVDTFWLLNVTLGSLVLLWSVVNFCTTLLAAISFAGMLAYLYQQFSGSRSIDVSQWPTVRSSWSLAWTPFRISAATVIATLSACLVGATAIHSILLEDHVEITAHRGASGKAPENTMAAVLQAIADDADWVEIDVQETKDGVVVVAHDSDLKKVAGVDLKIWQATAAELQAVDIGSYFDPRYQDERVPTLADVLQACRGRIKVNIELKYYGHDEDLERKVVDLVEQHEMQGDVVVMSLKAEGIAKIKRLRPTWTVGLLTAVAIGDITRAEADFLAVRSQLATRAFVRAAHKKQLRVHAWTANDTLTLSTMASRGVDNVITDHPALARQVLLQRASMSPVERTLHELAFMFGAAPPNTSEP